MENILNLLITFSQNNTVFIYIWGYIRPKLNSTQKIFRVSYKSYLT